MRSWAIALLPAFSGLLLLGADGAKTPVATNPSEHLEVPPPPFSDGIFPCSNCHAGMTPDRHRRELTAMHTDIVLKHDETHRWCLDCHDADNRDVLHLASLCRSTNPTVSAASAMAKSIATGGPAFMAAAPATGMGPRPTCCA